ncbi:putative Zn-dependent protease [Dysgonomonas hofstadii]|uniref:Putative Zn-dependent protease n=1 Tax=Dysgonomonas hofstadii TaxID=637886 RepID=A0A840CNX0_9BACT|nr:M48 family metalloprotease [Dysgonomonas hofstadii]MBB4035788.1 putative Zn-dependent protease [Dysgonomonas hofstadii]
MKKEHLLLSVVASAILFAGCSSVPLTGRKQLSLVSNQEVLTLSLQQYDEFIKSAPVSTDKANTALVQKVGRNIANAVETYLKNNGYADELASYSWEFNLVKSADVNAFCMPGGKIVVYEGILPYTQNETGLAVVLGHEVAHAVAKHANERMSNQMAAQYGTAAVGAALGGTSAGVQQAAAVAMGLGAQYGVLLPYSRKQELEADQLGLIFMAMAGYDPSQAAAFWQRMSQQGSSTPEFMSTHPSDNTRIQQIQKDLPEALKYYKGAGVSTSGSAKTSEQWKF